MERVESLNANTIRRTPEVVLSLSEPQYAYPKEIEVDAVRRHIYPCDNKGREKEQGHERWSN